MSEAERRYVYRYDRVLIEVLRVIDSDFPGVALYLDGGQVEILRNLLQYAHRQTTYVEEYGQDTYTTPKTEDFDSILLMVTDLEEKLMGPNNLLWGYSDTVVERVNNTDADAGTNYLQTTPVPAGEIHTYDNVFAINNNSQCTYILVTATVSSAGVYLKRLAPVPAQQEVKLENPVTLKPGDFLVCSFTGCTEGDVIRFHVYGTKMLV